MEELEILNMVWITSPDLSFEARLLACSHTRPDSRRFHRLYGTEEESSLRADRFSSWRPSTSSGSTTDTCFRTMHHHGSGPRPHSFGGPSQKASKPVRVHRLHHLFVVGGSHFRPRTSLHNPRLVRPTEYHGLPCSGHGGAVLLVRDA